MSGTIFIAGRYNKYSRTVSQTPWFVGGNQKVADSVEGFIVEALKGLLRHKSCKFLASGREDVDVRMLGRGRPFALEVAAPDPSDPSQKLMHKIQAEVERASDGRVRVTDLQVVRRKDVNENLKDEEKEKTKKYTAVCCCSRTLTPEAMKQINQSFTPIVLQQKTPIRVLHRRPLAVRPRTISQLQLVPIPSSDFTFSLTLVAESGTYIKEFVHSDFGRTSPSLCHVIGDCTTDILSLDVEEVFVDWPPPIPAS